MRLSVIGYCQRGASHILKNLPCQDAFYQCDIDIDTVVVAIADGHGSESCPYSEEGSSFATKIFCQYMSHLYHSYEKQLTLLAAYLHREGSLSIAQNLVREWRNSIKLHHSKENRYFPVKEDGIIEDEMSLFHMYGTTLIGILITPEFHFALQIGDGDVMSINENIASPFLASEQILGVETHSMCNVAPWKYAHSTLCHVENDYRFAYVLATDGFKNSHASQRDFEISCIEYIEALKENGAQAIQESLPEWLAETSRAGCGDDITLAIVYKDESTIVPSADQHPNGICEMIYANNPRTRCIEKHFKLVDPVSGELLQYLDVKPGKNDSCPCGSGIKYKRCCGRL